MHGERPEMGFNLALVLEVEIRDEPRALLVVAGEVLNDQQQFDARIDRDIDLDESVSSVHGSRRRGLLSRRCRGGGERQQCDEAAHPHGGSSPCTSGSLCMTT